MAESPPPQPPPPTTIAALGDDILREIFLRLPDITTLARAAFACRPFLRAVRSSPAFRRRFRELRAPPLLALFVPSDMRAIVPAAAGTGSGIAAAFARLPLYSDDASEWRSSHYYDCCANFSNQNAGQGASYNPHLQALKIFPKNVRDKDSFLEFHTLSPDGEEKPPSRVVCVHRECDWAWARVAVFSSDTMEWQAVLPDTEIRGSRGRRYFLGSSATGMVVNGFVCWVHKGEGCILALNTTTFHFSWMDLPPPLKVPSSLFQVGHTKDWKVCIVSVQQCMPSVWLLATDNDGFERFIAHKTFSLRANVSEIIMCSEEADVKMKPMAVINGFVYLSLITDYWGDAPSPEWFLSFCLETAEVNLLHRESKRINCQIDPYIMASWPSSLIHGKEDSESRVTGNISEDDGPMGTDEASPVLFTALQSFKEKLIDDGNSNFVEIDYFLLDDEMNSLLNRISTLESRLVAGRDRVMRIRTEPNSMEGMKFITSESGLPAATDSFLRIGSESDSMEGMERVSCWQICKVILGRACSRFFTR